MDLNIYTSEMAKSVWDKSFFMDKVPGTKCIIDFGCADGAMIHFLAPLFPDITFIGYDINKELIDKARSTTPYHSNVSFMNHPDHIVNFVRDIKKFESDEICLNFSSVLHEVFSSTANENSSIPALLQKLSPKYVTVRDMFFEGEDKSLSYCQLRAIVRQFKIDEKHIADFEVEFGNITSTKNLVHFLMKYQWKDNGWYDELDEDYFAWTMSDLKEMLMYYYDVIFETHYMLPYYINKWEPVGLTPKEIHTHIQLILRRRT
jgi:hypothetical protein